MLMGDIYRLARCVMIWLGKNVGRIGGQLLFSWLNDGVPYLDPPRCGSCLAPWIQCEHIEPSQALLKQDQLCKWVDGIPRNPWLSRIWTFQEIFLVRRASIHAGPFSIDWEDLVRDCDNLAKLHHSPVKYVSNIKFLKMQRLRQQRRQQRLENLLVATRGRKTSEPCDRIRALIRLLPPDAYPTLRAMRSSHSAAHIYAETTRLLFHDEHLVNILLKAWAFGQDPVTVIKGLPPWSIGWLAHNDLLRTVATASPEWFNPNPQIIPLQRSEMDAEELFLQAYFIIFGIVQGSKQFRPNRAHSTEVIPPQVLQQDLDEDAYIAILPKCVRAH